MKRLFFLILFTILLSGCSDDSSSSSQPGVVEEETSNSDFVEIFSEGKSVVLGTNDPMAMSKERPEMNVLLGQNFFMGKHEVTCGEFNDVMGDVSGVQVECESKDLPAVNVTFFDAVLYANAKSKAEKKDTVYTFENALFDERKNCINLGGFVFHPERSGYRLPTEAEWVFVAKANWNFKDEWLGGKSNGERHAVCSYENAGEICDMTGNVKEWVNDWLGAFKDTTALNFVGASDGGSLGERVLKGGYFRKDSSSTNVFSRGDVYNVNSATKSDYVGFRLAYGAIYDAMWINENGFVATRPIVPLANSSTLRSVMGSFNAKVVFRNDNTGNLAYIDFSQSPATVVEIADSMDVYHPDISPDGQKVTFCTGLEGVSGKSEVYVRNLDEKGSGLVKLNVESAAIPRWRVNGTDTSIVYVTDAGVNKNEAEFLQRSTWMVRFSNGAFGTPEKLFDGAYHGGVTENFSLAVTGATQLRAKMAIPGKSLSEESVDSIWYGGEQVCNVSLSKDGLNRVSFLDFGGKTGAAFVGASYAEHEYLLIADSTGALTGKVHAPEGYSFDHTEWTTGFVVATLANLNGAHSRIVLVNVDDGSIVNLVEGDELWHPCVWVHDEILDDENAQVDYDSAGVYYVEGGTDRSIVLRYRMETFWKYKDSTEFIGIGSSRTSNGFDPYYLKSVKKPINLAYFRMSFADPYEFYRRYIRGNAKSLKYVLVSLDLDFWYLPATDCFFEEEYKNYPGYVYDENHDYWRDSDYRLISEATSKGVEIGEYREMFKGDRSSLFLNIKGWNKDVPLLDNDSTWMDIASEEYENTFKRFEDLLKMTKEDGVILIGVIFPVSPTYKNTGSFGRYGLRRSEAVVAVQRFAELQKAYPHFYFMDENKMGDHDYTAANMAQDDDHLAPEGAKLFTNRLDSLIQKIQQSE